MQHSTAFSLSLSGLRAFVNDEGTRSFVALMVQQGCDAVCKMVAAVNKAFIEHGLQPFYQVGCGAREIYTF